MTAEPARLAPFHRRLWLHGERAFGASTTAVMGISGPLDVDRLRSAITVLCGRHEMLRTRFVRQPGLRVPARVDTGEGQLCWQFEGPATDPAATAEPDAAGAPAAIAARFVRAERDAVPDPNRPVSLRLGRVGPDLHVLSLAAAAGRLDTHSLLLLFEELTGILAGGVETAPPTPYSAVADWQHVLLAGELVGEADAAQVREFFASQAAGDPVLPFATAGRADGASLVLAVPLGPRTPARLAGLADDAGNPEAVPLALCHALATRTGTAARPVVDVVRPGRPFEELLGTVGPLARPLPIGAEPDPRRPWRELVASADERLGRLAEFEGLAELAEPQASPFACEVLRLAPERDCGPLRVRLLAVDPPRGEARALVSWRRAGPRLEAFLSVDTGSYSATAAGVLARTLGALADDVAARPARGLGRARILAATDERTVHARAHGEPLGEPDTTLPALFVERAGVAPARTAIEALDGSLTYAQALAHSELLAAGLAASGVRRGTRVAVRLPRSAEAVLAVLGILRAGAVYVPLDPDAPTPYLAGIVRDCGAELVLVAQPDGAETGLGAAVTTTATLLARGTARTPPLAAPGAAPGPGDPAYIIYTSGSTGTPKGVVVRHGSLARLLRALDRTVYAGRGPLRASLNAPLTFDASVKQLALLGLGHTLCVIPERVRRDPADLARYLARHRVQVLDCTPTQLRMLLGTELTAGPLPAGPLPVSLLLVGGEPVDEPLWQRLSALSGTDAVNLYGPTEATVDATAAWIRGGVPTVGRPLPGVEVRIMDAELRQTPPGVVGELCLAGASLALGYVGQPGLTASRFVPHPHAAGQRLYRTGDAARYRDDGTIELLGRLDRQLKIRGVRIEPGEIEAVLRSHRGVRDAAVVALGERAGSRLVACVVPVDPVTARLAHRRTHRLPNGAVVAHVNRHETEYLYHEIFVERTYARHGIAVEPGAVVFDVGANIGMAALFFHLEQPGVRVYAFEPVTPLAELARLNARIHGIDAVVLPYGLADTDTQESIAFYPDYSIMSSRYADAVAEEATVRRYIVNQQRDRDGRLVEHLDDLLAGRFDAQAVPARFRRMSEVIREHRIRRIDLLKIDVQKSELDVLRGIDEEHWPLIHQVVMEVHDVDGRVDLVRAELTARGLRCRLGQDELLAGTDRFHVYARRDGGAGTRSAGPAAPAEVLTVPALREYVAGRLAEQLRPAAYLLMDELPRTGRGKVDLTAVAAAAAEQRLADESFVEPRTGSERRLARIWGELLDASAIGVHDNFFEIGGNSIVQVQAAAQARDVGLPILPKHFVQYPTIAELAAAADAMRAASRDELPLLPGQATTLESEPHAADLVVLDLDPRLDRPRVRAAVDALIEQLPVLAMNRPHTGETVWRRAAEVPTLVVLGTSTVDNSPAGGRAAGARVEELLSAGAGFAVVLAEGRRPSLALGASRLLLDGPSWEPLLSRLGELLAGRRPAAASDSIRRLAAAFTDYRNAGTLGAEIADFTGDGGTVPRAADGGEPEVVRVDVAATDAARAGAVAARAGLAEFLAAALAVAVRAEDGWIELERDGSAAPGGRAAQVGPIADYLPMRVPAGADDAALMREAKRVLRTPSFAGFGRGVARLSGAAGEPVQRWLAVRPMLRLRRGVDTGPAHTPSVDPAGVETAGVETAGVDPSGTAAPFTVTEVSCRPVPAGGAAQAIWTHEPDGALRLTVAGMPGLADAWRAALSGLSSAPAPAGYHASDFPEAGLDDEELHQLISRLRDAGTV